MRTVAADNGVKTFILQPQEYDMVGVNRNAFIYINRINIYSRRLQYKLFPAIYTNCDAACYGKYEYVSDSFLHTVLLSHRIFVAL